jgi:threonine dehydrogenase-like Zn-dependent dehydrogenase
MKALVYHGPGKRVWEEPPKLALVDTSTTAMLLKSVVSKSLRPELLITHRVALDDSMKAYDAFGDAAQERALKVLIGANGA